MKRKLLLFKFLAVLLMSQTTLFGQMVASSDTLARVQTGSFSAYFDLVPSGDSIDAVVGLSQSATESFPELSAIVSCDKSGVFKAYKGDGTGAGGYENDSALVYVGAEVYAVKIDVDIISKSYSVTINSESMTEEVMIAENYSFRYQADTLSFLTGLNPIADQSLALSGLYTEWESWPLAAPVNGALMFEWDLIPSSDTIDALVGLADGPVGTYGDLSPIVVFSPGYGSYQIKARNGADYMADEVLVYQMGTSYHITMKVNVETNTYDVVITPSGEAAVNLATNYTFRKEVTSLAYWSYKDHPTEVTEEQLDVTGINQDDYSWKLDVDEALTGNFSIEFDATSKTDVVDAVIFFNDNMPLAEWWANVSAGIVFGGQGTHTIKVRNGDMYEADSLITFEKDSPIHFKVDMFVDVADNANNVYSVTATKEGGDPIVIASDYAFRNPAENIAYYFVKDFTPPQVLEEVIFENFEVELSTGMKPTISGKSNMDLKQNYPNPFSEITTISYTLKEDGLVRLSVYSESGSLVASLVNGRMVAGDHQIDFNASGFESGVYFYKIETQKFVGVKQMILIK